MKNEIGNVQHIYYHKSCLTESESKMKKIEAQPNPPFSFASKSNSIAFSRLKTYLTDELVTQRGIRSLTEIYTLYSEFYENEKPTELDQAQYKPHYLLKKILEAFPSLTTTIHKNRTFIHDSDLKPEEKYSMSEGQLIDRVKSVAYELRKLINTMKTQQLPRNNIQLDHIIQGECEIPVELYTFVECLTLGPRKCQSKLKRNKIISLCNSLILTTTDGAVKPSTSLQLGLSTKSLTGSRQLLDILNRMGFSISYSTAEEIETELAYGHAAKKNILPFGLTSNPNLCTHVAFDNYDRFVETTTGKNTLHDTVGIVYQNADNNNNISSAGFENNMCTTRRRRTYISSFDSSIEPYQRRVRNFGKLIGTIPQMPESWNDANRFNTIWLLNHVFDTEGSTRWFAFHSQRILDQNPVQRIGYLPNMNSSPTSEATIKKTLEIAMKIADECNQPYSIVTYDLAIASKAYKIQRDMTPQFDCVFITLGAFHVQLSLFKVYESTYRIHLKIFNNVSYMM